MTNKKVPSKNYPVVTFLLGIALCPLLCITATLFLAYGSYRTAQYQEGLLKKGFDRTAAENCLFLFGADSIKNRGYLIDTEKKFMREGRYYYWMRYNILYSQPIDVMYDTNNKVREIVATYE